MCAATETGEYNRCPLFKRTQCTQRTSSEAFHHTNGITLYH